MGVDKNGKWFCSHKSWMEPPKNLTDEQNFYLSLLETLFEVETPSGELKKYELTSSQSWWHLFDFSLTKNNSKHKVQKKARGTSFTTSSIISMIMSGIEIGNPIIPIVRLNSKRAEELISEFKSILHNMKNIETEDGFVPFDSSLLKTTAVQTLELPNGNKFKSFPANADSSEIIRGIRTHFGFLDETNYMRKFKELLVALLGATFGSDEEGKEYFQIIIGSTLKGETPFSNWLENEIRYSKPLKENPYIRDSGNFLIFDFPIFERTLFERDYNGTPSNEIPFMDNKDLVTLVPWYTKEYLWEWYRKDPNIFLEEYMAVKIDSEQQFYNTSLVMDSCRDNLEIDHLNFDTLKEKYSEIKIGIDVASVNDYFVIFMVGKKLIGDGYENFYLEYKNKVDLEEMQEKCYTVLDALEVTGLDWTCRVDSFGIGLQITQNLQKRYHNKIIGNRATIKVDGVNRKTNEYGHTKLKTLMIEKKLVLIEDETLIKHFSQWNYNFKADSNEFGHGDITMAALYAMLSNSLKVDSEVETSLTTTEPSLDKSALKRFIKSRNLTSTRKSHVGRRI